MKNIRLFSILGLSILLISFILTTNVYAHSVKIDPDNWITLPTIISNGEGKITIKDTEMIESLYYQAVEISDSVYAQITKTKDDGEEVLDALEEKINDLKSECEDLADIYTDAAEKYKKLIDEDASEDELAEAKEKYDTAKENYETKVKECNDKVKERNEKSEEINNKIKELIPSYVDGNWVEAEDSKFKVDLSKFSGNKIFVIWVKLYKMDRTTTYDCSVYTFKGNKTEEIKVTSVSIDQEKVSINKGEEIKLNATINPSNATDKILTWTSSDEEIAKVEDGKVTGISEGKVTITVTTKDGNYTDTCEVTVTSKIVEEDKEQDKEENKEDTNTQVKDPTIAGGKIPQTGVFSYITVIAIVLISAIGIVTYIRNKDLKLK